MELKDTSKDVEGKNFNPALYVYESYMIRPAIRNPRLREEFKGRHAVKLDWEIIKDRDRRVSRAIKEIINGPTTKTAPNQGGQIR